MRAIRTRTGLAALGACGSAASASPRLSLGAEIFHEAADAVDGHATTSLGLGGIYHLGGPFSLLLSGGPAFEHQRDGTQFNAYMALGQSF